ncbi:WD40 repeat domain-containing protein [Vibrio sp. WXL103]|uniref:WD40 repeat domain-containing protein n=1 Tax=Vibrio sp. WXL103 TaxID=3450710 RepID=UPI003EC94B97
MKREHLSILLLSLLIFGCDKAPLENNEQIEEKEEHSEYIEAIEEQEDKIAGDIYSNVAPETDRIYDGDNNFYIMRSSKHTSFAQYEHLEVMYDNFPKYFVPKAKEWPRENLNDHSSYDMPRFQFVWANTIDKDDRYENSLKIWSMKTDGTDLRLVTDLTVGQTAIRGLARSPNNRYVTWADAGGGKNVYDLKTQEHHVINRAPSPVNMAWSQDSKYFYFQDRVGSYFRWNSHNHEYQEVKVRFTSNSFIEEDKLTSVTDTGVFTRTISDNNLEYFIALDKNLSDEEKIFTMSSISPDGKHAMGSNRHYGYLFDIEKRVVTKLVDGFIPTSNLGVNARYVAQGSIASVKVIDQSNDKLWAWEPFYDGYSSGDKILYNGLANDGLWFKENK